MADELLTVAWNNHVPTFFCMLSRLRQKEKYADATLTCGGKFYNVHKLVLATCSSYFMSMFEKTPCKHPVIVLKDIRASEMEALLTYMYSGVVSVAQKDLSRFIAAAEYLQIKGLAAPDDSPYSSDEETLSRCPVGNRSMRPPNNIDLERDLSLSKRKEGNVVGSSLSITVPCEMLSATSEEKDLSLCLTGDGTGTQTRNTLKTSSHTPKRNDLAQCPIDDSSETQNFNTLKTSTHTPKNVSSVKKTQKALGAQKEKDIAKLNDPYIFAEEEEGLTHCLIGERNERSKGRVSVKSIDSLLEVDNRKNCRAVRCQREKSPSADTAACEEGASPHCPNGEQNKRATRSKKRSSLPSGNEFNHKRHKKTVAALKALDKLCNATNKEGKRQLPAKRHTAKENLLPEKEIVIEDNYGFVDVSDTEEIILSTGRNSPESLVEIHHDKNSEKTNINDDDPKSSVEDVIDFIDSDDSNDGKNEIEVRWSNSFSTPSATQANGPSEVVMRIAPVGCTTRQAKPPNKAKGEKYKCPYCSYSFDLEKRLKSHIIRHTGEKPFQCSSCSRRFSSQSTLKRHMISHLAEN